MEVFSKEGILYYVQADHLNGEEIGSILHYFYEAGACNVQVIPTITKKNRPGHLILIDTKERAAKEIEMILAEECKVTGWHRITTEHRHLRVDYLKREVTITWKGESFSHLAEGKCSWGVRRRIRPEHRSSEALRDKLRKMGLPLPLSDCSRILTEILDQDLEEYEIGEKDR